MSVKVNGLKELTVALKKSPELTVTELNKSIARSIGILQNQTIKEAPVNKVAMGGNLRQSIKSAMLSKLSGEVSVEAKYGIYVHEGTAPHTIVARGKTLYNKRSGQFFGKKVNHPGTRANPFLQRAIKVVTPRISALFTEAMNNVFNKIKSMV